MKKLKKIINLRLACAILSTQLLLTTQCVAVENEAVYRKEDLNIPRIRGNSARDQAGVFQIRLPCFSYLTGSCIYDYFDDKQSCLASVLVSNDLTVFEGYHENINIVASSAAEKIKSFVCRSKGNLSFSNPVFAENTLVQCENLTLHALFEIGSLKMFCEELENLASLIVTGNEELNVLKIKKITNTGKVQIKGKSHLEYERLTNRGELFLDSDCLFKCEDTGFMLNKGSWQVSKNVIMQGGTFRNQDAGKVEILGSARLENITLFHNECRENGAWRVDKDFYFQGLRYLSADSSITRIGGIWEHHSEGLDLQGLITAGRLAAFDIAGLANFCCRIEAGTMRVFARSDIRSNARAQFKINHHFLLDTKDTLDFDSRLITGKVPCSSIESKYGKGIFFSAKRFLNKGNVVRAASGCIELKSGGGINHNGFTSAERGNAVLTSKRDMLLRKDTYITAEQIRFEARNFSNQGTVASRDYIGITADTVANEGRITTQGRLQVDAKGSVHNTRSGEIKAGSAFIRTKGDIDNKGSIRVEDFLALRGFSILNQGYICGKNIQLDANLLIANVGGMIDASGQVTMNSPFVMNLFGYVQAKNLTINALFDMNIGARAAQNMTINALISLNAGLDLPTIPTEIEDVLNAQNLEKGAKFLINTFAPPGVSHVANILFALKNIPQLYAKANTLLQTAESFKDGRDVEICDLIPLICGAKDLLVQSWGLTNSVSASLQKAHDSLTPQLRSTSAEEASLKAPEPESSPFLDFAQNQFSSMDTQTILTSAIGLLGPHQEINTLFNASLGVNLGVNISENTGWTYRQGVTGAVNFTSYSAFGSNIQGITASSINVSSSADVKLEQSSASSTLNVTGRNIEARDVRSGQSTMKASSSLTGENLYANTRLDLEAQEDMRLSGKISARDKLSAKAGGYMEAAESKISAEDVSIFGMEGVKHGAVDSQNVTISAPLGRVSGNNPLPDGTRIVEGQNLCVKDNLERLLKGLDKMEKFFNSDGRFYYNKFLQELGIETTREGLSFSDLQQALATKGFSFEQLEGMPTTHEIARLEALNGEKASVIVPGTDGHSDHMMGLEKGENGQWYAVDNDSRKILFSSISNPILVMPDRSGQQSTTISRDTYVGMDKLFTTEDGRYWLEEGDNRKGLTHIIERKHGEDFVKAHDRRNDNNNSTEAQKVTEELKTIINHGLSNPDENLISGTGSSGLRSLLIKNLEGFGYPKGKNCLFAVGANGYIVSAYVTDQSNIPNDTRLHSTQRTLAETSPHERDYWIGKFEEYGI
ncbi:MAG: hypothetical protein ACH349_02055 [Candidatus Rhabdochlamydia sp.]